MVLRTGVIITNVRASSLISFKEADIRQNELHHRFSSISDLVLQISQSALSFNKKDRFKEQSGYKTTTTQCKVQTKALWRYIALHSSVHIVLRTRTRAYSKHTAPSQWSQFEGDNSLQTLQPLSNWGMGSSEAWHVMPDLQCKRKKTNVRVFFGR